MRDNDTILLEQACMKIYEEDLKSLAAGVGLGLAGIGAGAGLASKFSDVKTPAHATEMPRAGAAIPKAKLASRAREIKNHLLKNLAPKDIESFNMEILRLDNAISAVDRETDPTKAHNAKNNLYNAVRELRDAVNVKQTTVTRPTR